MDLELFEVIKIFEKKFCLKLFKEKHIDFIWESISLFNKLISLKILLYLISLDSPCKPHIEIILYSSLLFFITTLSKQNMDSFVILVTIFILYLFIFSSSWTSFFILINDISFL